MRIILYCNMLYYTAIDCIIIYYTILYCTVLYSTLLYYTYTTPHYATLPGDVNTWLEHTWF